MITLDTLQWDNKAGILRLAVLHGCRNIRVFGSVATGENRPDSDVDILVDLDSGRTIFDLAGFLGDRRDLLGAEIDVVDSRSIHPYIRGRVIAYPIHIRECWDRILDYTTGIESMGPSIPVVHDAVCRNLEIPSLQKPFPYGHGSETRANTRSEPRL